MANYPSPCEKCTKNYCDYTRCQPWLTRYRYRQKQINAYAKKVLPDYYDLQHKQTTEDMQPCGGSFG